MRIVAAAIKIGDCIISVPRPGRHHTIFWAMDAAEIENRFGPEDQGFLTSEGDFVDRVKGLEIAKAADQIIKKHGNPNELYSEDMW